jgi:hypothetical protein
MDHKQAAYLRGLTSPLAALEPVPLKQGNNWALSLSVLTDPAHALTGIPAFLVTLVQQDLSLTTDFYQFGDTVPPGKIKGYRGKQSPLSRHTQADLDANATVDANDDVTYNGQQINSIVRKNIL